MDVRLWRRPASLTAGIVASTQRHSRLDRLFLEVVHEGVTGYGEVSPLARALVPDPGIDGVVRHASKTTVPRMLSFAAREGRLPEWSRIHLWAGGTPESAWSSALLEMALLDWSLARDDESLQQSWAVPHRLPLVTATTSLIEPDPMWRPPVEATRVRAKVDANTDPSAGVELARRWERPVIWDFNAGARTDAVVHAWVAASDQRVDLVAVEQPFAPGDLAAHALLARDIAVPLSLDESVTSPARVRLIARHGAASIVCVKPPRVGGLASARATIAEARACGLQAYVGGFFESPLARRTHAAIALCTNADASDVAPVDVSDDSFDEERRVGLGTVPSLQRATLLFSWESD